MAKHNKQTEKMSIDPVRKSPSEGEAGGSTVYGLDKVRIGKLLKHLREKKGMKQHQLAEKIGASQAFVFMYESGKTGIGWDMLDRIGKALDVPSTWIVFLSSPDDAPNITPELREEIKGTKERIFTAIKQSISTDSLEVIFGEKAH